MLGWPLLWSLRQAMGETVTATPFGGCTSMPANHSLLARGLEVVAMPFQKVRFWDPGHWRYRAEEARTVADQMTHDEARTVMRRIANDYERLAKLAEEQIAAQEKQSD